MKLLSRFDPVNMSITANGLVHFRHTRLRLESTLYRPTAPFWGQLAVPTLVLTTPGNTRSQQWTKRELMTTTVPRSLR